MGVFTRDESAASEKEFGRRHAAEDVIAFFNHLIEYERAAGIPRGKMESSDYDAICGFLNGLLALQSSLAHPIPGWSAAAESAFEDLAGLVNDLISEFELEPVFRQVQTAVFVEEMPTENTTIAPTQLSPAEHRRSSYSGYVSFQFVESHRQEECPFAFRLQASLMPGIGGSQPVLMPLYDQVSLFTPLGDDVFLRCASALRGILSNLLEQTAPTQPLNNPGVKAGRADVALVYPIDSGGWSTPDSPSQWARRFNCSLDTLNRLVEDKKIRVNKLTSKLWQVWIDDVPTEVRRPPQK